MKDPIQMSIEDLHSALCTERNVACVYQVTGPICSAPPRSVLAQRRIAELEDELRNRGEDTTTTGSPEKQK